MTAAATVDLSAIYGAMTLDEKRALELLVDPASTTPVSLVAWVDRVYREAAGDEARRYQWYPHAKRLADVLERVADGVLKRVIITMPPRMGKSLLTSQLFSSYYVARYPERFVALASYSAELAHTFSRNARRFYRDGLGVSDTGGETDTMATWETGKGGGLWAVGVRGSATGRGASLLICDDVLKDAAEAASETIQRGNYEWFQSVAMTRLEPHGAVVIISTRWHQRDLVGQLLAAEDGDAPERWHVVNFPAVAEEPEPHRWPVTVTAEPDDRAVGEPLCPERLPLARMAQIQGGAAYWWSALYQQRPSPREGGQFKRNWFEVVPARPADDEITARVRAWDTAATEGGGDYTAGVLMLRTRSDVYYVEHVVRGQWASGARDQRIRQTAVSDGREVLQLGSEDPGAAGKDSALAFRRLMDGYRVVTLRESGSKEVRADPFASAAYCDNSESGRIKLVRGEWNEAFLAELANFPHGAHDDQVDAASNAYARLSKKASSTGKGYEPFHPGSMRSAEQGTLAGGYSVFRNRG